MAELFYNQEVEKDLQNHIKEELGRYITISDTHVISTKSPTVSPELIKILLSATEWIDPFKVAGTYFLYQMGKTISLANKKVTKNIIDSLWENREEVYEILRSKDSKPIKDLTDLIMDANKKTSERSKIIIGFPFPDEFLSSDFEINKSNELAIAFYISKFVKNAKIIESVIRKQCGDNTLTPIKIKLLENGNFLITWKDENLKNILLNWKSLRPPNPFKKDFVKRIVLTQVFSSTF